MGGSWQGCKIPGSGAWLVGTAQGSGEAVPSISIRVLRRMLCRNIPIRKLGSLNWGICSASGGVRPLLSEKFLHSFLHPRCVWFCTDLVPVLSLKPDEMKGKGWWETTTAIPDPCPPSSLPCNPFPFPVALEALKSLQEPQWTCVLNHALEKWPESCVLPSLCCQSATLLQPLQWIEAM